MPTSDPTLNLVIGITLVVAILYGIVKWKAAESDNDSDKKKRDKKKPVGNRDRLYSWLKSDKGKSLGRTAILITVYYLLTVSALAGLWEQYLPGTLDFVWNNSTLLLFWYPLILTAMSLGSYILGKDTKLKRPLTWVLVTVLAVPTLVAIGNHLNAMEHMTGGMHEHQARVGAMKEMADGHLIVVPTSATSTAELSWDWQLVWRKDPDDVGRNPAQRVPPSPLLVSILKNDESMFNFVMRYTHHGKEYDAVFSWDKSEKYGKWSQPEPALYGQWYLVPSLTGIGFSGSCTDNNLGGSWVSMDLVPIIKK